MNRDRMRELLRSAILLIDALGKDETMFWKNMKLIRISKEEIKSLGLGALYDEREKDSDGEGA